MGDEDGVPGSDHVAGDAAITVDSDIDELEDEDDRAAGGSVNGRYFDDAIDSGEPAAAGLQGATSLMARESIGAAIARTGYEEGVKDLDPTDRAARTALKESTRAATPPVSRAIVESARPDTGPRPGSTASANRSNAGRNRAGQAFGIVGPGATVVGVGFGAARIATADDKIAESARVGGGVLGGIAAGTGAGVALGALGANPLTIGAGAGAVVGAVVGGIAGEAAVDRLMNRLGAWWRG